MASAQIGGVTIQHGFPFDPTYGYTLDSLLQVRGPQEPEGYADYWRGRYRATLAHEPEARISFRGIRNGGWLVFKMRYESTCGVRIRGWALLPEGRPVRRGFVVGHGYGGRDMPDFALPFDDAVILFPCLRGISRSPVHNIPADPVRHVVHGIESRDNYVIGGCVEDTWLAVSALLRLFPEVRGHVGYIGGSFGGGVGALALAWDERVQRAHLSVPTFGKQPLRLELPTTGSGVGVQSWEKAHPGRALPVLAWYDAAIAARYIRVPVHCACALFDPAVAPPGQFAVYNELGGDRKLFVLPAGHHEYPEQQEVDARLRNELRDWFAPL